MTQHGGLNPEAARLAALHSYGVLDSDPEPMFDGLARAARFVMSTDYALISLIDANRQWFKACDGLGVRETPREISFCRYVVATEHPLLVLNAREDARFAHNPLVTGYPNVRFYYGTPLRDPDGFVLGTLCVIHAQTKPEPTSVQRAVLDQLADVVVERLVEHRRYLRLRHEQAVVEAGHAALWAIAERHSEAVCLVDASGRVIAANAVFLSLLGEGAECVVGRPFTDRIAEPSRRQLTRLRRPESRWAGGISRLLSWVLQGRGGNRVVLEAQTVVAWPEGGGTGPVIALRGIPARGEEPVRLPEDESLSSDPDETSAMETTSARFVTALLQTFMVQMPQSAAMAYLPESRELIVPDVRREIQETLRDADLGEAGGLIMAAMRSGEAVWQPIGDMPDSSWRELLPFGYRSVWVQPLADNGSGALVIALPDSITPDGMFRELVSGMAEVAGISVSQGRQVRRLARRAEVDALTGLANRVGFLRELRRRRRGLPENGEERIALLMIDLDRFKWVNDHLGHHEGDRVLAAIARAMASQIRPRDLLARWGGDEFVAIATVRSAEEAEEIAARLRAAAAYRRPEWPDGVSVGASVGIVVDEPGQRSVRELLQVVDRALYRAKKGTHGVRVSH